MSKDISNRKKLLHTWLLLCFLSLGTFFFTSDPSPWIGFCIAWGIFCLIGYPFASLAWDAQRHFKETRETRELERSEKNDSH